MDAYCNIHIKLWLALYLLFRQGLFKKANHLCSCLTQLYPFAWCCCFSSQKCSYCTSYILQVVWLCFKSQFVFGSTGQSTTFSAINLMDLLPTDKTKYFRYPGSLTTPPCSEAVTWSVFKDPVMVSQEQVKLTISTVRNDVWETSAEIPYWWPVTTQIWVVLLIGWIKFPTGHDQSEALPRSG